MTLLVISAGAVLIGCILALATPPRDPTTVGAGWRLFFFVFVAGLLGAGWEIATYRAAAQLNPASLGRPLAVIHGISVYAPWKWWTWMRAFGAQRPAFFRGVQAIGYGTVVAVVVVIGTFSRLVRCKPQSHAYGSARWAKTDELRAAGLGTTGVVLCQSDQARYRSYVKNDDIRWEMTHAGELICDNSDAHILCCAPTGSGKGISLICPTLLSWLHSVVVYDPKGELYKFTSGWRRKFSHIIRFEPTSRGSARYNPLFAIPRGEGDVREAQNIAEILVPKDAQGKRDHWQLTAYKLLVGAILHVLYAEERKDLGGVLQLLTDPNRTIKEVLKMMLSTHHLGDRPHPQVVSAARAALNKSDNELSGVVSTAETCLDLWLDPIVAQNTSCSDFCAEQLNSLPSPVSLYLVVPTPDIERLRPLIRLMVIQIGNRLTVHAHEHDAQNPQHFLRRLWNALTHPLTPSARAKKQRLLFLLDEFPTLGFLPWIESAIAYLRGYKIKLLIIAQSLNQLEKIYGPHHAFIDNSWARLTFTSYDDRTARRISDLLGQRTEVQERESRSKRSGSLSFDNVTRSEQEHGRALMTAGELLTLRYDDVVLFVGGVHGYRGRKIMYYLDPRFAGRANLPTPDSPEEQAAELPKPAPAHDWKRLAARPAIVSPTFIVAGAVHAPDGGEADDGDGAVTFGTDVYAELESESERVEEPAGLAAQDEARGLPL